MSIKQSLMAFAAAVLTVSQAMAQQAGFINVSVGRSPTIADTPQPITLFGCNNQQVETDVFWDTQNQVVGNIPYGERISSFGKPYFLSKYYVASPPAWRGTDNHADPYIGLVIPDRFQFIGDAPAQILYLDYRILKPTYLKNIPVDFNYQQGELPSCRSQGVTQIPINTSCSDFPWRIGAKGAAGIGQLTDTGGTSVFCPLWTNNYSNLYSVM